MYISSDILTTLGYFDAFNYPLKKREIYLFLPRACDNSEFENALQKLVNESLLYRLGEFYSLQNNYSISQRRITGNEKAKRLLLIANKVAAFLSKFPFVKGVAISGSLSKNFADENSDIDLFIITKSNRLWISRTILHLFKKLTFLVDRQHYFCMNYFIDEEKLGIAEKNVYTATEIATLMPLYGSQGFQAFFSANSWMKEFLPNNYMRISSAKDIPMSFGKRFAEAILEIIAGNRIDNLLMKITESRWQQKRNKMQLNNSGTLMSMDASKHFAKPDPREFQAKLVALYFAKKVECEMMLQDKVRISPAQ